MRFTIRDLLLATALVGVSIGWFLDRSRLAQQALTAEEWVDDLKRIMESDGWKVQLSEFGTEASKDERGVITIGRDVPFPDTPLHNPSEATTNSPKS